MRHEKLYRSTLFPPQRLCDLNRADTATNLQYHGHELYRARENANGFNFLMDMVVKVYN